MCNRASGARCAGVPNLGWIGGELVDFLPRLCGGMCGRALILATPTQTQSLQRNLTDLPALIGRPHRSCQTCAATTATCAISSAYASSATPPPRRPVSTSPEACEQVAPSVRDAGARGWNSGQRSKSPRSGALAWPHLGVRARRNSLSMGPLGERSPRGRFRAGPRARTTGQSEISVSTFGTHFPPRSGRTTKADKG